MTSFPKRLAAAGGLLLLILYLYGLGRMGIYGPDEPRYASIGREMAWSQDYVTPRLWGQGWYEKPALLYWMIAAGFKAGLSNDLAPRVPVALLSAGFLMTFFWMLRREFNGTVAAFSTMILATSAMWVAYSSLALTDIPVSVMFGLALLFTLPWLRSGDRRYLMGTATALALAFLAKSGPPLVLALPILWFGRDKWRDLLQPRPLLLFVMIAAPWYVACAWRNGHAFLEVLFVQQQFQRLTSPVLKHVQPWWFYFPFLAVALFPWTPLLALFTRRSLYSDIRIRYLLVTAAWGFLFFSIAPNKLPGYILPLLPPLAIAAGVALERAQITGRVTVGLCALACSVFPVVTRMLPAFMSRELSLRAAFAPSVLWLTLIPLAAVFLIRNRAAAVSLVALCATAGYLCLKVISLPASDAAATARPVALAVQNSGLPVCVKNDVPRDLRYGLNYYTVIPLPDCLSAPPPRAFVYDRGRRLMAELPATP